MTHPRVLVVDDQPLNIELVGFVLRADGWLVESATDAVQAVTRLAEFRPDVILELTRRIKADPTTREIVVIAFTAYAMRGDEARLLAAGCDAYISKPIDVERFSGQVRACLRTGAPPA
jgi:CheY-like chemotaxis protein